ncbi:Trm112 family protein [Nocardia harenae]|uniref:Trm112 family protein n=1 Tax=Nocardia harenae TaxID=358707 RepID=UPI000835B4C3|nr:Trm112 family protein [Nocardia harenae]
MPEQYTLDPTLLSLLACPEDKGPLRLVRTADGSTVLYNERLARAYPIDGGIPVLLIDEALPVSAAEAAAFTEVPAGA